MAEQKILYKVGSKGDEVTNIQNALGDYYTSLGGVPDADYGSKTHDAVYNWQKAWNDDPAHANDQITKDGIVGPQTYPRLMQWSKSRTATPTTTTAPAGTSTTTVPAAGTPAGETRQPVAQPTVSNPIINDQTAKMNAVLDPATGKAKEDLAPKYLVDWSNVDNVYQEAKRLNLPLAQVLADYQRWGNDTGNPTYWINAMFQDSDLTKSVGDNEEEKKKAERRERWNSVSNFLLHLGNVIGNVGGGNYASMKLEDPVQWTERQRMLKEKALEQRRLNNQSIYQQMRQGWADQRNYNLQQQRLENEKLKAGLQEELAKARKALDEKREQQIQAKIDELNAMLPLKQDTERSKAQKNRQQGNAATTRAARAGQPKPIQAKVVEKEKTDYRGRKSTEKTTTYPAGNRGNGGNAFGNRGKGRSAFGSRK